MAHTETEKKKLNHELRRMGFGDLNDRGLIPAIGFSIRDHEHFRSALFAVMPDKRKIAYDTLRPHLRFEAKPLDVYEAESKHKAEIEQLGRWNDKTHQIEPFTVGEVGEKPQIEKVAEAAILAEEVELKTLYLLCAKCTANGEFAAPTRTEAEKIAAEKGWRASWDGKSHCKRCAKKFLIN